MGGVVDGQPVSAAITNPAFIEKNADDQMPYQLDFTSVVGANGPSVISIQKNINALFSFMGGILNSVYNVLPVWTNNNTGTNSDTLKARIEALDAKFNAVTGHTHDGTPGNGGPISSAGGGGGGSLFWVEDTNSPLSAVENSNRVYSFANGDGTDIYALIKVPGTYASGAQIKLKTTFYSPDSSGTALLNSISTLIRTGTDAITSTTNQRTSSNSAVTLGAGTVNIPQAVILDLTDATGKINGVSVSAGDLIRVQLLRGTDSATSDIKVPVFGTEVTFSG